MEAYVAFEGPIAAGKTTWATRLAPILTSELLLEKFEENEYLVDYYRERSTWAFPMQLWFLTERHRQLTSMRFDRPVVADYAFVKEDAFSRVLFTGRDLRLYTKIREQLGTAVPQPSLFVYVDARTDVLLHRIKERARPYEQDINADYLNRLRGAYDQVLDGRPVVRVDTSELDLDSKAHEQDVVSHVFAALKTAS